MTSVALIMMISTITIVSAITFYFFWRVIKTPPKSEPDSYRDNNDEIREEEN